MSEIQAITFLKFFLQLEDDILVIKNQVTNEFHFNSFYFNVRYEIQDRFHLLNGNIRFGSVGFAVIGGDAKTNKKQKLK